MWAQLLWSHLPKSEDSPGTNINAAAMHIVTNKWRRFKELCEWSCYAYIPDNYMNVTTMCILTGEWRQSRDLPQCGYKACIDWIPTDPESSAEDTWAPCTLVNPVLLSINKTNYWSICSLSKEVIMQYTDSPYIDTMSTEYLVSIRAFWNVMNQTTVVG